MINGVLAEIQLTDPRGPGTHPLVHFPDLDCVTGIDTFGCWYNLTLVL